jgi:signal transduction histidine kinase
VAKEVTHLLGVSLPEHVTLRCDLADRVPCVKGDPTQIFQMVMNLFTNAAEALPAGGEGQITVRTRTQQVDTAALASAGWILPVAPGRFAILEVTDNGIGMTSEILARVLEPFYTTKPTGHGLGLAAVTGILRGHGGGLKVVSEPGRGSSFTLYLPAVAEARPAAGPGLTAPPGHTDSREIADHE